MTSMQFHETRQARHFMKHANAFFIVFEGLSFGEKIKKNSGHKL